NGCTATSGPYTILNTGGPSLNTANVVIQNQSCNGTLGSVTGITATGVSLTYAWTNSGGSSLNATNLVAGTYSLTVTDGNGCLSIATTTVSSFYDAPIISLGADVSTCDGNEVILTPGGGFVAYNWSNGASATDISPVNSGNYTVTVTDVNACSNNDEVIVTFVAPPAVDLGADTLVCLDDATTSIVIDATESFVNYNWNTGDTSSVITISQSGLYSVTVDNGDQCFGSDAIIVVFDSCINVGEDELAGFASQAKLALYPNPNRGSFVLETEGLTTGNYLVRVSSISGQMVEKRNLNIVTGLDSRDEFNLSNAAKGIYILTIEGNEIQLNQRIVIE
ncbi:MAG: T9SS type A sorting domain-containing protein, partial [Salibacteraceae bacterium]|nr:T9SS type A sorting domain-containing protein [Salibacteraceae bacterium]